MTAKQTDTPDTATPDTACPTRETAADPTTDVTALADQFMRMAKRIRHRSAHDLAPLNLTPSQARALRAIARAEPVRIVTLAARLDIVPRSATTVVDALEQQGLVTRAPDPADRRSVLVQLSPVGRDRMSHLHDSQRQAAGDLFRTLPTADRTDLARILATLDTALAEDDEHRPMR